MLKKIMVLAGLSLLSALLNASTAFAEGYTRQICFGIDRDSRERNSFAIIAQRTDNSIVGPEGFIPSHNEYDSQGIIGMTDTIHFSVYIYDSLPGAVEAKDHKAYASTLINEVEPTILYEDASGERLDDQVGYFWGNFMGEFSVYYDSDGVENGYRNTLIGLGEGVSLSILDCPEPYIVATVNE